MQETGKLQPMRPRRYDVPAVRMTAFVHPDTLKALEARATKEGSSIGVVLDRLIESPGRAVRLSASSPRITITDVKFGRVTGNLVGAGPIADPAQTDAAIKVHPGGKVTFNPALATPLHEWVDSGTFGKTCRHCHCVKTNTIAANAPCSP